MEVLINTIVVVLQVSFFSIIIAIQAVLIKKIPHVNERIYFTYIERFSQESHSMWTLKLIYIYKTNGPENEKEM